LEKLEGIEVDILEVDGSGYRARSLDGLDEVVRDLATRKVSKVQP
jgi:hypothetical protein